MAEVKQIAYTNKELLLLLLKDQGINEGNWILGAQLTFTAMNIGHSPDGSDVSPAGVVGVTGVVIERVPEPLPFSINAEEVNPTK
ncbi:hypothetical protein [Methylomonas rhizoryzae]|uniref:hypothetical protein n=1 Tax=Methylomonas rhizoryzae TaxID=2608981 RepID=UPI001232912D|nr:hypothetical protein [Methylomonas rhizoryzae]